MDRIVLPQEFDFNESERIKQELKNRYPFLVCHSIGKSVCGRDITAYSLGNYRNIVLFAGGFHAQEWLTGLVLLRFLEKICESIKNKKKLSGVDISSALYSKGITIVPCINPDGVEVVLRGVKSAGIYESLINDVSRCDLSDWNANVKGVDINHNFDAG